MLPKFVYECAARGFCNAVCESMTRSPPPLSL